ncbi:MaoC family dehydratase [Hydrogenophaga sp. BPS33]|uniref:MaoC family dehydratase n=1 Tax=Hydrogenophaga sp. BPS33 TaxID=2651974 RepID=UPI00131FF80A|nr:MaoC family dehydratase [Hydrogenophaga sp. BPS33]QHE84265.1 MaoC family dehydratase [Hydrogenophaga sp. BPS33]
MNLPILSMKPGDIRSSAVRTITLSRVLALSGGPLDKPGWPDKNLHTDEKAAAAAGLPHIVASGTQWEGHMAGLMVDTMGLAWFSGGSMNVKIPRSVQIGDSLVSKLQLDAIVQRDDDRAVAEFTVWCENAQAQQVLVGTATCPMPQDGGQQP